jgi:tight adherence protein C
MYLMLGVTALAGACVAFAFALDLVPVGRGEVRERIVAGGRPVVDTVPHDDTSQHLSGAGPDLGLRRLLIAPGSLLTMKRNVSLAGKSPRLLPTLVVMKLVAPLVWILVGYTLVSAVGGAMLWIVFFIGLIAAYMYPDIYIRGRAVERQAVMIHALPDVLDQVTVALDAGMSFEAAFARVGQTHRGPLGPEISRTVQDLSLGVPRREAYTGLADRNDIPDLKRFVKSLVQAEEFGVPIAQVVRLQANEMRDKRRQRAAATAQTVPLKLLFPMMSTLLPVLFIILLTPAVMGLGDVL